VRFGAVLFAVQRVGVILVQCGGVCFAVATCGAVLSPGVYTQKKKKKKKKKKRGY